MNTYLPHSDSLAGRVAAYFRRIADDEEALSIEDISIKWSTDRKNVPVQLSKCVEARLLKKDGSMYSAGPEIDRIDLRPGATLSVRPGPPKVAPPVDIESIAFEDIPPTAKQIAQTVHDRWCAKLRTMPAGKSFAMPSEHRHALRSAVTAMRKEGWRMSVLNDSAESVRVVCTAVPGSAEGGAA